MPVTVGEDAEAKFEPISLKVSCSIKGKRVVLSHRTHLTIGRMIKFKHKVVQMKRAGDHKAMLSMTAEMPGGVRETVDTTLKIGARVDRNGAVNIAFNPIDFDAKVTVSRAFAATAPRSLYGLRVSFRLNGTIPRKPRARLV